MKRLLLKLLAACFLALIFGQSLRAQAPEREKPRLVGFGISLTPGYVKPKPSPSPLPADGAEKSDDVLRIDTNLVLSDVLVSSEKGVPVNDLTAADFVVTEDGAAQHIESFTLGSSRDVPRSIVLVMDYSGSLQPYLKKSVAAAKILVDQLNPRDKMAIVTDDVELLVDFTRDKSLLKKGLDALEYKAFNSIGGRSRQFSALYAALNELFDAEDVRPIVIFQTDGDEYSAVRGVFRQLPASVSSVYTPGLLNFTNFTLADLVSSADRARATIYTIIPAVRFIGITPEEGLAQARLHYEKRRAVGKSRIKLAPEVVERSIAFYAGYFPLAHAAIAQTAVQSGGWAKYLENPDDAEALYARLLNDINNRYLLGYYPTDQTRDGKRRTVKITVKDHPEYVISMRRSYYALGN